MVLTIAQAADDHRRTLYEHILDTLEFPAAGCAIDHLRISNRRRDFTVLR